MSTVNSEHLKTLQSLRGLAAVTVMVHHSLRLIADADVAWLISEKILNAHAAVVIFFVLSGYVLTLSLLRRDFSANTILQFLAKRAFRIYPALWIGIMLGVSYLLTFSNPPKPYFTEWGNSLYQPTSVGPSTIVGSLLGLRTELLPPLWTIKVELAASIALLPGVVFVLNRQRNLFFPVLLLVSMVAVSFRFPGSAVLLYLYQFVIGAICAVYSREIKQRLSTNGVVLTAAAAILVAFRQAYPWPYHHPLPSLVEAIASAVLIMGLAKGGVQWMAARPLVYLGDISYGIYLFHLPLALFTITIAMPRLQESHLAPDTAAATISLIVAAITLAVAALVYRYVELPFIALGRKVADAIATAFRARADHVV